MRAGPAGPSHPNCDRSGGLQNLRFARQETCLHLSESGVGTILEPLWAVRIDNFQVRERGEPLREERLEFKLRAPCGEYPTLSDRWSFGVRSILNRLGSWNCRSSQFADSGNPTTQSPERMRRPCQSKSSVATHSQLFDGVDQRSTSSTAAPGLLGSASSFARIREEQPETDPTGVPRLETTADHAHQLDLELVEHDGDDVPAELVPLLRDQPLGVRGTRVSQRELNFSGLMDQRGYVTANPPRYIQGAP